MTKKKTAWYDTSRNKRVLAKIESDRRYKEFQLSMLDLIYNESPELFKQFLTTKALQEGTII